MKGTRGVENSTAMVLAGGRSRRMGADKATLELQGATLLERAVRALLSDYEEVLVIAAPGQALPQIAGQRVRILRDEYPDNGPLAGICTGLKAVEAEYCPVVACDMPFLNPRLLTFLVDIAVHGKYEAVVPEVGGQLQYLHAVYARSMVLPIEEALIENRLALRTFLKGRNIKVITEVEATPFDPTLRFVFNINTREDLAEAGRLLEVFSIED